MTNQYDATIDHAMITVGREKLAAVIARRATAQSGLVAAQDIFAAAKRDYDAALLADGDTDATRQRLDDAARKLAIAQDMLPAVEAAIKLAEREFRAAHGAAHQGAHDGAVDGAIAACAKGDEGRALLVAAETEFRGCVAAIRRYVAEGAAPVCHVMNLDASSPRWTKPDGVWAIPGADELRKRFSRPGLTQLKTGDL